MESQLTKRDKKALKTIFLKVKTFCWPYSLVSYLVPAMVLSLSAMISSIQITLTQTLSAQASEILSTTFPDQEQLPPTSP